MLKYLHVLWLLDGMGRKTTKKQVVQKLGGENAYHSHIFPLTHKVSFLLFTFGNKPRHLFGMKVSGTTNGVLRKQFVYIIR
jgi:hypothetical protein